jgi:hypothetical protein
MSEVGIAEKLVSFTQHYAWFYFIIVIVHRYCDKGTAILFKNKKLTWRFSFNFQKKKKLGIKLSCSLEYRISDKKCQRKGWTVCTIQYTVRRDVDL